MTGMFYRSGDQCIFSESQRGGAIVRSDYRVGCLLFEGC